MSEIFSFGGVNNLIPDNQIILSLASVSDFNIPHQSNVIVTRAGKSKLLNTFVEQGGDHPEPSDFTLNRRNTKFFGLITDNLYVLSYSSKSNTLTIRSRGAK